jgi:hypothetical protein
MRNPRTGALVLDQQLAEGDPHPGDPAELVAEHQRAHHEQARADAVPAQGPERDRAGQEAEPGQLLDPGRGERDLDSVVSDRHRAVLFRRGRRREGRAPVAPESAFGLV